MYETGSDFTNTFRKLSLLNVKDKKNLESDIKEFLHLITDECSKFDEYKETFKPKFPTE